VKARRLAFQSGGVHFPDHREPAPFVLRSVLRVTRTDGARIRVHVAGGAVIVALGAVRIGLHVRRDVSPVARGVALDRMAVRVCVLCLCRGSADRQRRSQRAPLRSAPNVSLPK
jgi:hypothetical protein